MLLKQSLNFSFVIFNKYYLNLKYKFIIQIKFLYYYGSYPEFFRIDLLNIYKLYLI
jgi:hypothetical protein